MIRKIMLAMVCLLIVGVGLAVALPPVGGPPIGSNWTAGCIEWKQQHYNWTGQGPHDLLDVKYGIKNVSGTYLTEQIKWYVPNTGWINGPTWNDQGNVPGMIYTWSYNGGYMDDSTMWEIDITGGTQSAMFGACIGLWNDPVWDATDVSLFTSAIHYDIIGSTQSSAEIHLRMPYTYIKPEACANKIYCVTAYICDNYNGATMAVPIPSSYTWSDTHVLGFKMLPQGACAGFYGWGVESCRIFDNEGWYVYLAPTSPENFTYFWVRLGLQECINNVWTLIHLDDTAYRIEIGPIA